MEAPRSHLGSSRSAPELAAQALAHHPGTPPALHFGAMGQGMPLPAGGVRMAVPMQRGEQAQWPVSTIPIESLEATAQEWYRFRENSWGVKLYNHYGIFIAAVVILMVLLGPGWRLAIAGACRLDDSGQCHTFQPSTCDQLPGCIFVYERGEGTCTLESAFTACEDQKDYFGRVGVLMLVNPILMVGLVLYVKCRLLPRLRDEAGARLAAPLSQALAGTGWSVKAHSLVRSRGTQAPQGLRQGCCSPGWIWLEFVPHDSPVVGAPPAALAAPPAPDGAVTGFVVDEPGVARARELQPVLAHGAPPGRLRPLLAA
ncbi:unnamed protein product [Prorocentrum cordatum]|uniref:Uncharacterized protein n=1 Tax=Prorocentrum cordatum TaxID=2364126 RepID=A0ABN9VGL2_9DINO|nr:unnamed protein product [Polarella glacialis]